LNYIAKWNGTGWQDLQNGTNGIVNAVHYDKISGLLYIGGSFSKAGNLSTSNIAW